MDSDTVDAMGVKLARLLQLVQRAYGGADNGNKEAEQKLSDYFNSLEEEANVFFDAFLSHLPSKTLTLKRFRDSYILAAAPKLLEPGMQETYEKERISELAYQMLTVVGAALVVNDPEVWSQRDAQEFRGAFVAFAKCVLQHREQTSQQGVCIRHLLCI